MCDIVMHDIASAGDTEIPNLNYISPVVDFYLVTCFPSVESGINLFLLVLTCFCYSLFPANKNDYNKL